MVINSLFPKLLRAFKADLFFFFFFFKKKKKKRNNQKKSSIFYFLDYVKKETQLLVFRLYYLISFFFIFYCPSFYTSFQIKSNEIFLFFFLNGELQWCGRFFQVYGVLIKKGIAYIRCTNCSFLWF